MEVGRSVVNQSLQFNSYFPHFPVFDFQNILFSSNIPQICVGLALNVAHWFWSKLCCTFLFTVRDSSSEWYLWY